jgi:hypothetical protein
MADTSRARVISLSVLTVVFLSGLIVGMAFDRVIGTTDAAPAPAGAMASPDEGGEGDRDDRRRERRRPMYAQVGLDDAQEERIDSIVRHYRDEVRTASREARRDWESRYWEMVLATRASIRSVMDADQAARYDSLLEASDRRREEWEEKRRRERDRERRGGGDDGGRD